MENIKENIKENLIMLRKSKKLTQKQLAEKFNYSDKAVSRWENGESMPDIDVLISLCKFYEVEFEWLIKKNTEPPKLKNKNCSNRIKIIIALLFFVSCYAVATIIFVYNKIYFSNDAWILFLWALPVSLLLISLCSFKWWSTLTTTILVSLCMWATITCSFVQALPATNAWPIFLIGVPIQAIIVLIHQLDKQRKK